MNIDTDDSQWQPGQMADDSHETTGHAAQTLNIKEHAATQAIKPMRPITRKEKAFVQELVKNPKTTLSEAYKAVYDTKGHKATIQAEASRTASKPQVKMELAKYSDTAKLVLLEVLEQSRTRMTEDNRQAVDWAVNARQTADSLLDRVHGKATIKQQIESKSVTLNIDLSGVTEVDK